MGATVEPLHDASGGRLDALVDESEEDGLSFVRRLVVEWVNGANRFARPGEVLFGASVADRVVGVCGLNVDPYARSPRVGRVRHLYVEKAHRRSGVGEQLVREVIAAARQPFERLHLRTTNPVAARLYERLGFARAGAEDYTHFMDLR